MIGDGQAEIPTEISPAPTEAITIPTVTSSETRSEEQPHTFLRHLAGLGREKPAQPTGTAPEHKQSRLTTVKEVLGRTGERIQTRTSEVAETARELPNHPRVQQARQVAQELPGRTEDLLAKTREERLAAEILNRKRNPIQKMFGSTIGKVLKTGIEMIPSPVGYGPGDLITAASALTGRDVLSGEYLDRTDRVINGLAALIPLIPATPVVEVARIIRHHGEEAVHAKREGNPIKSAAHARGTWQAIKDLRNIIRPPKPPTA